MFFITELHLYDLLTLQALKLQIQALKLQKSYCFCSNPNAEVIRLLFCILFF